MINSIILILLSFLPNIPSPTVDHIEVGEWQYYELDYICPDEYYDTIFVTEEKQYYEIFDQLCFYARFNFINNKAIARDHVYDATIYLFRINSKHFWGYVQYQGGISYIEFKKL